MRLYEITCYAKDEDGYLVAMMSWIVSAGSNEEIENRCTELSKSFRNGVFTSREIETINIEQFGYDYVLSELESL